MASRGSNKKSKSKNQPLWRKDTGGRITLRDGRSFGKGETFNANPNLIPEAFMDGVTCLTPPNEMPKKSAPKFFLREVVGTAEEMDDPKYKVKYDVIDVNNKVMTENPLKKKKAEKFIEELES